jgi:RHS repeat-associated protein
MNLNGTEYYYFLNAQGDVVGLVDCNGNVVVEYTYDAWSNILSTTGSLANTVGAMNPYRYRGYRFDNESGLYYLQSRYYNPAWGRFISADSQFGNTGLLLDHNLYAYCRNNAVNANDPFGFGPPFPVINGWWARIDHGNPGTGTKAHIHIYKGDKDYAQNDDGSPHDNSKGSPPNLVKYKLKTESIKSRRWDWDAKAARHARQQNRYKVNSSTQPASGSKVPVLVPAPGIYPGPVTLPGLEPIPWFPPIFEPIF